MSESNKPIQVYENAWRDQVATGIRYTLLAASSIASSLGYAGLAGHLSALCASAGPVALAAVFIWGQISSRKNAKIKAALVPHAPNDVATFK